MSEIKVKHEGVLSMGYGLAPFMICADRRITDGAFRLYCILTNFAREKDTAFPSQKTLSDILDVRVATISILSTELETNGYIEKTRGGNKGRLTYTIKNRVEVMVQPDLFGNVATSRKKVITKKGTLKETVPKIVIEELKAYYFEIFKEACGHEPDFMPKRDYAIIAKYLRKYDIELLKGVLDNYMKDEWGKKVGYTLTCLQTCFNKLLTENNKKGRVRSYGFTSKKEPVQANTG